jgi:hypothetical protein
MNVNVEKKIVKKVETKMEMKNKILQFGFEIELISDVHKNLF